MESNNKYICRMRNLGIKNFLRYTFHKKTKLPRNRQFTLYSKYVQSPLFCRGGSSDIDVFKHIFVLREYDCLDLLPSAELIVDCGANVGFSSAYLLSLYPDAELIAVEPDPGNFDMLKQNTVAFGSRCTTVNAGVWSKTCGLRFSEEPFGDGRQWAVSVREARADEQADIKGVDVQTLLEMSPRDRISLLKIDIEGSEKELFQPGCEFWLERVDNIIIELHGEACSRLYVEAVRRAGFKSKVAGGLVLSTRS